MKKLDYVDVKKYVEDNGYKLLNSVYIDSRSKLKLQCSENHIFNIKYGDFQQGHRCPECAGNKKLTIEKVKEYIENFGYKLQSGKYKNASTKLELKCPEGHIFEMRYGNFYTGQRCPKCFGTPKKTLDKIEEYIESFEYKLLSNEYIANKSKLRLQCIKGHQFLMRYNDFQQGQRCPLCKNINGGSKPEKVITEHVKSIYSGSILENDRNQIKNYWTGKNLELDIWLPEMKKAIEYNGEYWHNNDKVKWYDEMKKKQCFKKGINILVIKEQELINDRYNIFNKIDNFILEGIKNA